VMLRRTFCRGPDQTPRLSFYCLAELLDVLAGWFELEPESQNAFHGTLWASNLELVYALVGEQDQAITLIERLLSTPGAVSCPDNPNSITLAELRLRQEWDSLRSTARFQKILAGPEPKTVY
jgi:hypothetical protein